MGSNTEGQRFGLKVELIMQQSKKTYPALFLAIPGSEIVMEQQKNIFLSIWQFVLLWNRSCILRLS